MPENPRIEELRRRVQADPASIAFAALAEEFRRVGRYEDAIETCRTGLTRHPAYLSARVTLGRALIETGDYTGAQEELETVLRSAPENLAAIRGLAQIHERLGHSTEMHPDLHAMMQEPIRLAGRREEDERAKRLEEEEQARRREEESVRRRAQEEEDARRREQEAEHARQLEAEQAGRVEAAALHEQDPPFDDLVLAPPVTPATDPAGEPFDIFAAALQRSGLPTLDEPPAVEPQASPLVVEAEPDLPELPPVAFEHGTIAFEAPVTSVTEPDPHVAATLLRLEQFLGAIQSARHA